MINIYQYWQTPPPTLSDSCQRWQQKIKDGWRPNRRISQMGYADSAKFFRVYIWEYLNVIYPLLESQRGSKIS